MLELITMAQEIHNKLIEAMESGKTVIMFYKNNYAKFYFTCQQIEDIYYDKDVLSISDGINNFEFDLSHLLHITKEKEIDTINYTIENLQNESEITFAFCE